MINGYLGASWKPFKNRLLAEIDWALWEGKIDEMKKKRNEMAGELFG